MFGCGGAVKLMEEKGDSVTELIMPMFVEHPLALSRSAKYIFKLLPSRSGVTTLQKRHHIGISKNFQIMYHFLLALPRRVFGKKYKDQRCTFCHKTLKKTWVPSNKTFFLHILEKISFKIINLL